MAENPYPWLDPSQQPQQGGGFRWPWESGGGAPAAPAAAASTGPSFEDWMAQQAAKGGSNSTAAPASQPYILIDLPPKSTAVPPGVQAVDANGNPLPNPPGKMWINNPGYPVAQQTTAATAAATAKAKANEPQVVGGRLYVPDANGAWNSVTPESPDDQKKLADITQRQYNQALTGRYMTDEESLKYQGDLNKLGNDQAAAKRLQDQYEQDARVKEQDFKQKALLFPTTVEQAGANVANTRATTNATNTNAAATQQNIDVQKAKLPGELTQQGATLQGTQLSNQEAQQKLQQGNAPTVATAPTGMYQWSRDPNTGQVGPSGVNPEFIPKTMPEVMARIGQINSAMQAKSNEVQQKVGQVINGKQYTSDDALKDYNQWHDQQVAPQMGAIQAAQQQALYAQAKDEADQRRQALATAQAAGTGYTNAAQVDMSNRVGPGFQKAMNQIASGQGKNVDLGAAIGYRAPSVTQGAADAVHNALKDISPGAAAALGAPLPNFQGIDVNAALAPSRYFPGGGAPPPPAAPAAPMPNAQPPGPPLLPPGYAGMPGFDPRLQGRLNPNLFGTYQPEDFPDPSTLGTYSYGG